MKKNLDLIKAIVFVLLLFVIVMFVTANGTYYFAKEHFRTTRLDEFQIQEFSSENCDAVFESLAKGGKGLEDLMCGDPDVREFLKYADWSKGEYDDKRSYGGGSLEDGADANGIYEYADLWRVTIDGEQYMLYIQSESSRYGRENDGVSMIAVTTYEHFNELDANWDCKPDDDTLILGKSGMKKEE